MPAAPKKEIQIVEQRPGAMTPMDMLSKAIEIGNVDVVGKMMDYQERWERNQNRKSFDAAMAQAKAEMPVIIKDQSVDYTSQKGRTNYKYEDMAGIARAVDPILTKHGLSYRYRTASDKETMTVTCIISHRDGHFEENSLTAPNDTSGNKNAIQAIGSTQTYLQRYTLKAALGLAASKDDDAQAVTKPETIMQDQIDELEKMVTDIGGVRADELREATLGYLGISAFSQLLVTEYNRAVAALDKKKKKAKA
jgi:hypothetical protein